MADYIVTLVQTETIRTSRVTARSAAEAARAVHTRKGDPAGACYSVHGDQTLDGPSTIQVLPGRVRVMSGAGAHL
jgi:hypothetical protein